MPQKQGTLSCKEVMVLDPKDFSHLVFFFLSTLFLRVGSDYGKKVHWSVQKFSPKQR